MKPQTRRSTSNKSPLKGKNSNKAKRDPNEELYDEEANMSTDASILTDSEEESEDEVSEEEDSGIVDDIDEESEADEELEEDKVSEMVFY